MKIHHRLHRAIAFVQPLRTCHRHETHRCVVGVVQSVELRPSPLPRPRPTCHRRDLTVIGVVQTSSCVSPHHETHRCVVTAIFWLTSPLCRDCHGHCAIATTESHRQLNRQPSEAPNRGTVCPGVHLVLQRGLLVRLCRCIMKTARSLIICF